jgi:hypothetical protein
MASPLLLDDHLSTDPGYDSPAMRIIEASSLFQMSVLSAECGIQISGGDGGESETSPFYQIALWIGITAVLGADSKIDDLSGDYAASIAKALFYGVQKYNELVAKTGTESTQ